jgi:uncharacterized protein (DUF2267 family)
MISFDSFLGRVMRTGGLGAKDAHRATFATLRALGEVLDEPIVLAMRAALPHKMGNMFLANAPRHPPSELYARVASHEERSLGISKEHAETVCRILGTVLDQDLLTRIGKDIGRPELFESRPWSDVPPYGIQEPPRAEKHTLATGKPGYEHPIAEAAVVDAHLHSVARSEDPHADTKLSSASGLTQERTHQTLTTKR